jgi:hypothetical protein
MTLVGISESGYVNDELAFEWIQHFERLTSPQIEGEWRLLLCDNYGSHTFFEFLEFAEQHHIVVVGLPAHTSHLLQPLDVVLFQPYKHWHKQAVNEATRTGCTKFDAMEFFSNINSIRTNTFKRSSIRAAWKQAGIVPWSPSKVINRLKVEFEGVNIEKHFEELEEHAQQLLQKSRNEVDKVEGSRPSTPELFELPKTPLTIRTLHQAGEYLQQRLEN